MFSETTSIWQYLSKARKPVVIYGMGNGADKILAVADKRGIIPSAFMASDDFVRGHSFRGYEVRKLEDIEREYNKFIILIAFGTNRPDVLEKIYALSERHEVYAPDVPVYGDVLETLFDEKYIYENINRIVEIRELFEDEESKTTFDNIINYRISAKLEYLRSTETLREAAMLELLEIKPDENQIFFDFGAYDGDTSQEFLELTGARFGKIYAFEPDFRNFTKLRRRLYLLPPEKFEAINAAVADKDGEISFTNAAGRQSATGKGRAVKVMKADTFCETHRIKPDIMKFDVEGSEEAALNGSLEVLRKHRPKLLVSLYHRTDDLLVLPELIKRENPKYKIYLRRHEYIPAWDINLYCV